jgi:DNA-binding MarR family transcriptional regulator
MQETMRETPAKPKPEECNCLAVRQAARAVTQLYDRHLAAVGLTATQFWLLSKLVHRGAASINEVARLMMSDRTTVGRTLGPLEREGLIVMNADPEDRRSRLAEPTAEGRRRVEAGMPLIVEAKAAFEAAYGVERSAALRALLFDVLPALHPDGAGAVS